MQSELISDKTRMVVQGRSEGDGMENHLQYDISEAARKMYEVPQKSTDAITFVSSPVKRKGPKFIPYEPYKAAVSPIISNLSKKNRSALAKVMSNQHLIGPLAEKVVAECSFHTSSALPKASSDFSALQKSSDSLLLSSNHAHCDEEKNALNEKIQLLTQERKELESQLKIQTQVNSELKKLLVASLGEDLQLKVQYLSEDKAKLGEDILFYSEKLFENNEELDNLSVQCDVWKSKYQASSVIIDELAGWKVVLSKTFSEAAGALENLLKEHNDIFLELATTHRILTGVQSAFEPGGRQKQLCSPATFNMLQLARSTKTLSVSLQNRLLGTTSSTKQQIIQGIPSLTPAEQLAKKVIANIDRLPTLTRLEASKRSECGLGTKACQLLPHTCHNETIVNCCRHCSGEVKLI